MIENGFLKDTIIGEVTIINDVIVKITWENFSSLYVDVVHGDDYLSNDDIPMMPKTEVEDTPFDIIADKIYNLDLSLTDKVNLKILFVELNGMNNVLKTISDSLFPLSSILDIIITGINKRKEVK